MNLWEQEGPAPKRRRRGVKPALAAAIALLALLPSIANAAHVFDDVPGTNPFHSHITWLAGTGITTGCAKTPGTNYCPGDPVTRGQMAAFLQRHYNVLAGNFGSDFDAATATAPASGSYTDVSSTTVTVPAGIQARLLINFSAESTCTGGSNGIVIFTVRPACQVRVMVNGTEVNTSGDYYYDSSVEGSHDAGDWNSNALVRFTDPLGPGVKTVVVQAKPYECAVCGGYAPPAFGLRHRVLTVQALPVDAA
jgi:hypothetical protein